MDIIENSNRFLALLYFKSLNNLSNGFSNKELSKLLRPDRNIYNSVLEYVAENDLMKDGFGDNNIITTKGITRVEEYLLTNEYNHVKFISATINVISRDSYDFTFNYNVLDKGKIISNNIVDVSVSGPVAILWTNELNGNTSLGNIITNDILKLSLLYVKDDILEKLNSKILNQHLSITYLPSNISELTYRKSDFIDIDKAEFFEIRQPFYNNMNIELQGEYLVLDNKQIRIPEINSVEATLTPYMRTNGVRHRAGNPSVKITTIYSTHTLYLKEEDRCKEYAEKINILLRDYRISSTNKTNGGTNITINNSSNTNVVNQSSNVNIGKEVNETLNLLAAIKYELEDVKVQIIEQRVDILECVGVIEEKIKENKPVPKFAITSLLSNTANLTKISDFGIKVAELLGYTK